MDQIFHVSEDGAIEEFEPRLPTTSASGISGPVVWGVDAAHLVNYLLPRDCPRVTFRWTEESLAEEVERLIGPSQASRIVAIEHLWFERACVRPLWVYTLPQESFRLIDAGAGYYVSETAVWPLKRELIEFPLQEMIHRGAELRIVPSLWPLHDAIGDSTLEFSCIRMRNAQPRLERFAF